MPPSRHTAAPTPMMPSMARCRSVMAEHGVATHVLTKCALRPSFPASPSYALRPSLGRLSSVAGLASRGLPVDWAVHDVQVVAPVAVLRADLCAAVGAWACRHVGRAVLDEVSERVRRHGEGGAGPNDEQGLRCGGEPQGVASGRTCGTRGTVPAAGVVLCVGVVGGGDGGKRRSWELDGVCSGARAGSGAHLRPRRCGEPEAVVLEDEVEPASAPALARAGACAYWQPDQCPR